MHQWHLHRKAQRGVYYSKVPIIRLWALRILNTLLCFKDFFCLFFLPMLMSNEHREGFSELYTFSPLTLEVIKC